MMKKKDQQPAKHTWVVSLVCLQATEKRKKSSILFLPFMLHESRLSRPCGAQVDKRLGVSPGQLFHFVSLFLFSTALGEPGEA